MRKNSVFHGLSAVLGIMIFVSLHAFSAAGTTGNAGSVKNVNPQQTAEAIDYHSKLTVLFPELLAAKYNYTIAAVKSRRVRSIEKNRQELLKIIQKNQKNIQASPAFHDDSTLKIELNHFLDLLYVVMKGDFDKILDMEDIKAQTYDEDEAHQLALDMAFLKLDTCKMVLGRADSTFFKTYNIKVDTTKSELAKKLNRVNDAIDYYNPIYRVFSKSNKQYAFAIQVLSNKDLAALQQSTESLQRTVNEGSEKLRQFTGYENDYDLLKIVEKILEFYKKEAAETLPANIAFYLQVESFSNSGKKIESIKPETRKQKDIDEYNAAVKAYNKAVKDINVMNSAAYKKHSELLREWNRSVDKFFEIHR